MPPRQRTAAVNHYRKCGCGCDVSVKTAAAWYLPGHAPEYVAIENASGQWVKLAGVSMEPAFWALVGTTEDHDGLFVRFTASQPTGVCNVGHLTWEFPKGTMVEVKPTHKR